MKWQGKTVGYALSGSHCTFAEVMPVIKRFVDEGANVVPIVTQTLLTTDTRFGTSDDWQRQLKSITGNDLISTIVEAEPLGPSKLLDVLVIAPCTGNTTSKLANAVTDSPVLMAAKAKMRNQRPLVLAISTNDGLGLNAANIAKLLASEAAWHAAEACLQTHGGFGYAAEYDVERKWRETRVMQTAPISTNLILSFIGQHVLGMPRSF